MIRLTDSASLGVPASTVQYSSISPFNADNSRMLVLERANFSLYDLEAMKRIGRLAWLGDSNSPVWSRSEPNFFYYLIGNGIMECDSSTGRVISVRNFAEYVSISSNGEADLSEDCDHLVLCGDNKEVFVYEISTGKKGPVLAVGPLDALYITPDNNVLISWGIVGALRHTGVELYNRNMVFQRQLTTYVGHKAVGRDTDGPEIMVITDNNDNAVKKVRLSDGHLTTILPPLDWSLACHISCPAQAGFSIVSTYGKNRAGENLQVPLDGSPAKVLESHGSDSSTYDGEPRASVSHDGKLVAWNSNSAGLTDVYLEKLVDPPQPIDSQMVYQDARGHGKMSVATFKAGLLVENKNL